MNQQRQSAGIQSLDAALEVLAMLARFPDNVTLSELARACGMPPSKVHRYLTSFLKAGLIAQTGRSGRYLLGPAALQIGLAAIARHDFVTFAAVGLADLCAETGMTALLCVWGSAGATVVRWERASSPTMTSLGLGTTLPLLTSATGHAFLAWLPTAVTKSVCDFELRRLKSFPRAETDLDPTREGIKTLIDATKQRGYASLDGSFIPGLVAIAAPVLDWQRQAQAVVTLVGADAAALRSDAAQVATLVKYCAERSTLESRVAPFLGHFETS